MSAEVSQKIRELADRALEAFHVEGTAIAVVKDGETIFLEGIGLADRERNVPMTPDHVLPIASTSKAFTATGVALLVDEGKIDLDLPVREYMPDFALKDPVASDAVTARDLLCHRTGLPRHDLLWITWQDIPRDELVFKRVRHLPPNQSFRNVWQYQNHMYAAAGCLTERVSGKSWENFTRERIFQPLNMKSSAFGQDGLNPTQPYSVLYKENKQGVNEICKPESVACVGPAGDIQSTARDMAEWVKFNLACGKVGDAALMSDKTFFELQKPNIPYDLFPFEIDETQRIGYGLGWFVDCYRGEKLVQHGGNVSGASILVAMIPAKNIGCAILSNQDGSFIDYALAASILDLLFWTGEEKDWIAFYREKQAELKKMSEEGFEKFLNSKLPNKPKLHEQSEYCGMYSNAAYGDIRVFTDVTEADPEKQLRVDVHGNIMPLTHMHYDIFHVTIFDIPLPATFQTGVNGSLESLSIQFEPSMQELITFTRVVKMTEEEQR